MNKTELLDRAAGLSDSPRPAITLAWNELSDERIAKRRAAAEKLVKRFKAVCSIVYTLVVIHVFVLGASFAYTGEAAKRHSDLANAIMAIILGASSACLALWLSMAVAGLLQYMLGHARTVELLASTAGTDHCEVGAKALTAGGPLTAEWRDIALQERSQLYVFDVKIMEALSVGHVASLAKAKREAELAEACRVLHGVAIKN